MLRRACVASHAGDTVLIVAANMREVARMKAALRELRAVMDRIAFVTPASLDMAQGFLVDRVEVDHYARDVAMRRGVHEELRHFCAGALRAKPAKRSWLS